MEAACFWYCIYVNLSIWQCVKKCQSYMTAPYKQHPLICHMKINTQQTFSANKQRFTIYFLFLCYELMKQKNNLCTVFNPIIQCLSNSLKYMWKNYVNHLWAKTAGSSVCERLTISALTPPVAAGQPGAGGGWLRQDRQLRPHRAGRVWLQQERYRQPRGQTCSWEFNKYIWIIFL